MEKNINLIVGEDENNLRLDVFINKRENLISRTRIKNLILKEKLKINNLIINSYDDVNIVFNNSLSIMAYLKVRFSEEMDIYIYDKYLKPHIEKVNNKYNSSISPNDKYNLKKITINKADLIRFKNTNPPADWILSFSASFAGLWS
jgi:hypothetical protein